MFTANCPGLLLIVYLVMKAASQKQFLYCIVSINIYLKVAGAKRVLEIQQSTYISISFLD